MAEITEESLACETAAYLFLQCIEKGKYANNVPDMSPYDLDSSACDESFKLLESWDMFKNDKAFNDFKQKRDSDIRDCMTKRIYKNKESLEDCRVPTSEATQSCTCATQQGGTIETCGCSQWYVQCRKIMCESHSAIVHYRLELSKICKDNKGISEISGNIKTFMGSPVKNYTLANGCTTDVEGIFTCKLSSKDIKNFKFSRYNRSAHKVIYIDDIAAQDMFITITNTSQKSEQVSNPVLQQTNDLPINTSVGAQETKEKCKELPANATAGIVEKNGSAKSCKVTACSSGYKVSDDGKTCVEQSAEETAQEKTNLEKEYEADMEELHKAFLDKIEQLKQSNSQQS